MVGRSDTYIKVLLGVGVALATLPVTVILARIFKTLFLPGDSKGGSSTTAVTEVGPSIVNSPNSQDRILRLVSSYRGM